MPTTGSVRPRGGNSTAGTRAGLARRRRRPRSGAAAPAAFLAVVSLAACHLPTPGPPAWVVIPENAELPVVAESLAAHDIVTSASRFQRFARMGRRHRGIKPGIYHLEPGWPMGRVLAALRRGAPPGATVLVRERMTLRELAEELQQTVGTDPEELFAAARDSALRSRVGTSDATIEGYLYPTEYYVLHDTPALKVLRQMADTFLARWDTTWNARMDSLGFTRDETVTLASIIAGEMPHPDERLIVSSVYHNRLTRGMRLQADPTVVYALGERRRLTFDDYRIDSDYNTYQISGLPPGPIGQPAIESIEAALYPADTDFLYFVGGWSGKHYFSATYREHLARIRRLRGRR